VARVAVDVPLPHLDRPFDYLVPQPLADAARPGVRVRVRFAGQDVDGWLLDRVASTEHAGRLTPLRRVVSAEPVLTAEVLAAARAVADRYAGTLPDVLRLAVPPRHARVEEQPPSPSGATVEMTVEPSSGSTAWADYPAGGAFLGRLAAGGSPRAVWTALPGPHWTAAIAAATRATVGSGRGVIVVAPDRRDAERLEAALGAAVGRDLVARLEADLGPAARYAAFLRLLRGQARVAVGTRACAFAPVARLGLVVIWDDGDDQHAELRAPYPHAREVLAIRAEQADAAALIGGWSRSVEAAALVESGWAREIVADRTTQRAHWPQVAVAADGRPDDDPAARAARMPPAAWRAVHDGLARGPVLIQVARAGYLPGLSCQTCRRPARCPHCRGPVALPGTAVDATGEPAARDGLPPDRTPRTPECGWCGRGLPNWTCPNCQGRRLRARSVGVERTAEELGRAFPGAAVLVSRADRRLPRVPPGRTLVLATAGIEPPVEDGYAAAVLLDGDVLLERPDLRAGEESLRRWRAAAALVRPAGRGGLVVVCADPVAPAVQALIRADPPGFAARELAERAELGLPPAVTAATLTGLPDAVRGLLELARLPEAASVLGPAPHQPAPHQSAPHQPAPYQSAPYQSAPAGAVTPGAEATPGEAAASVPEESTVRVVIRVPPERGGQLARALHEAAAVRSARREPGAVRIQIDPRDLG
jgi:primosomal protein N' (replication factor Y)